MNFFNTKNGRIVKTVISVILAVGILAGSIALITTLTNKKDDGLKKISPTFEVGGLTETGKYKETKLSLYTKESFGCQGLKITPDFDAKVTYQIYYYDEVDNFISASEVYTEGVTAEVPLPAVYARLVVTPIWDNDVLPEDKELNIFDTLTYSNKLTIKVANEQVVETRKNLYVVDSDMIGKMYGNTLTADTADSTRSTSKLVDVSEILNLEVYYEKGNDTALVVNWIDAEGNVELASIDFTDEIVGGYYRIEVEVPATAQKLAFCPKDNLKIFAYEA